MAYYRINFLKTVIDIQEIVSNYKHKGVSQKWVYDNVIDAPGSHFHITYCTFRKYMTINAKAELKKLEQ